MIQHRKIHWIILLLMSVPVLLVTAIPHVHGQDIVINEILASNQAGITDEDGDTSDWIELFNGDTNPVDLSGFFLTDESDEPDQWTFPSIIIGPGDYLLVWASGKDRQDLSELHTNFKLNASGEFIGLFAPNGSRVDGFSFGSQRADISYGRYPNGSDTFTTFQNPTPGFLNEMIMLSFSHPQGIQRRELTLELRSNTDYGEIYYTLDGSEPDPEDDLYSVPISIFESLVIRARIFHNGTPVTAIETRTYIVNDRPMLPVLSVTTNPEHLWDSKTGIHSNYNRTGIDWERPAHLTLIENGKTEFSVPAGIRIHGNTSRWLPKKNFRMYFRSEYGESALNYPVFKDRPFTKYKRLVLYAPSRDQVTADVGLFTLIADALSHDLWFQEDGIVSLFRPVSLYLNGAYWGIYWIREYINRHYIESNFGFTDIDLNRINKGYVSPTVREGDADYWVKTYRFFEYNDLRSSTTYNTAINKYLDVDNFTDYHIFCIYAANMDWPHNNVDRFRDRSGDDPRWRFVMWDLDYSWRKAVPYHKTLRWATRDKIEPDIFHYDEPSLLTSTLILRKMLKNKEYKNLFITRFADLINTVFVPENLEITISRLANAIRPEMERELERWGKGITMEAWEYAVNNIRSFAQKRPHYMRQHILNKFYLGDTVTVKLLPGTGKGIVTVNSVTPQSLPWEGIYFKNIPIQVKAVPAEGYIFYQWSDTTLPGQPEVMLIPEEDRVLQADFYQLMQLKDILVESIKDCSAEISWNTNVQALSQIAYGLDENLEFVTDKKVLPEMAHSILLEDLMPDTLYYYNINCTDDFGQSVESAVATFRTLPNTATAIQQDGELPEHFRLLPNYPNPFNGRTCMEVAVPEPGHLHAMVYNLSGQEVLCLHDQEISPGTRNIYWDGVNERDQQVSSGVYIIRIFYQGESGETKTVFNKLILNR